MKISRERRTDYEASETIKNFIDFYYNFRQKRSDGFCRVARRELMLRISKGKPLGLPY